MTKKILAICAAPSRLDPGPSVTCNYEEASVTGTHQKKGAKDAIATISKPKFTRWPGSA
jgi:hypothetical protein